MRLKSFARLLCVAGAGLALTVPSATGAGTDRSRPLALSCEDNGPLCAEPFDPINYEGNYIGHDEPSVLFYSNTAGSGNNQVYKLQVPGESGKLPKQDGTGGTWNFQLHPTFWFGMALCDNQSAPNPGGSPTAGPNVPCTADSDSNIYTGTTPTSSGGTNYIGQHPGTAFMEMQFYPPGWTNAVTNSCDATRWCAAMTIDSLAENLNAGGILNSSCANRLFGGVEYINFAYITKNGVPLGPPDPLNSNAATFTPDLNKQLLMNGGDQLTVDLHDTAQGLQIVINDLTTGESGSMTASASNGFGEIQYAPTGTTCNVIPSDFHPMYSTSSENTRVVWAAHSYNVAYSDEIGHWEYCNSVDFSAFPFPCTSAGVSDPGGLDSDDIFCAPASLSMLVQVSGCTFTDGDFDGVSYKQVWPGIAHNMGTPSTPGPVVFSSPKFNGSEQYSRAAFEADLPRIEDPAISPNNNCNRNTGVGCVNPPNGADFYPMFVARKSDDGCRWFEGGPNFPGNTNNFGGSSTTEFGPLLQLVYPGVGGIITRYNNFRNILSNNPCTAN
jgi:hypothetical protein